MIINITSHPVPVGCKQFYYKHYKVMFKKTNDTFDVLDIWDAGTLVYNWRRINLPHVMELNKKFAEKFRDDWNNILINANKIERGAV